MTAAPDRRLRRAVPEGAAQRAGRARSFPGRSATACCAAAIALALWCAVPAATGDRLLGGGPSTGSAGSWSPGTAPATAGPDLPARGDRTVVPASAPTTLYLPAGEDGPEIDTELLALECGSTIPYPTSGPDVWRGFYCSDYALPGSAMPHYGIITGHSTVSPDTDTVLNRLLEQRSLLGREIYVRTRASGDRWLAFRFSDAQSVPKDELAGAPAWGSSTVSTAGRLVFLTCGQERLGQDPDHNILLIADYVGVRRSV